MHKVYVMPGNAAIRVRDYLIRAWAVSGAGLRTKACVLSAGDGGAVPVFFTDIRKIALLVPLDDVPTWETIVGLEAYARKLLEPAEGMFLSGRRVAIHVVLIGGDRRVQSWLKQVEFRSSSFRQSVTFHHVELEGEARVWDEEVSFPSLDKTLKAMPGGGLHGGDGAAEPLSHAELAALATGARQAMDENRGWGVIMQRPFTASKWSIGLIIFAFLLQFVWSSGEPDSSVLLLLMGACSGEMVRQGDYWRLVSPLFLHAGFAHLFFNMLVLVQLGPFLEKILGSRRFLVLFGYSAIGAHVAVALFSRHGFGVGASGGLWGLLAAGAVIAWKYRTLLPSGIGRALRRDLGIALLLNVGISLLPGISMIGHLGGGVVGALLMLSGVLVRGVDEVRATGARRSLRRLEVAGETSTVGQPGSPSRGHGSKELLLSISAATVSVVMVVGFLVGLNVGKPWILRRPPPMVEISLPTLSATLDVPAPLAAARELSLENPGSIQFGELGRHPTIITLDIQPLDALQRMNTPETLLLHFAESFGLETPHEVSDVNGHPTLMGDHPLSEAVKYRYWLSIREGSLVFVLQLLLDGLPEAWSRVGGLMSASLELGTGPDVPYEDLPDSSDLETLVAGIHAAIADGAYEAARDLIVRLLSRQPEDARAWTMLGRVESELDRPQEAVDAFQKSVVLDPNASSGYEQLGDALLEIPDLEGAAEAFRSAVELDPSDVGALYRLGDVLNRLGQYSEAAEALTLAREALPDAPDVTILLADVSLSLGEQDAAREMLEAVLETHRSALVENNVAYTLVEHGTHLPWALELARSAVEKQSKMVEEARDSSMGAVQVASSDALVSFWDTLGTVYLRLDRLDEAAPYLSSAWRLTGNGVMARHIGELWQARGDSRRAMTWCARATVADPPDETARSRLLELAGDEGRVRDAIAEARHNLDSAKIPLEFSSEEALEIGFLMVLEPAPSASASNEPALTASRVKSVHSLTDEAVDPELVDALLSLALPVSFPNGGDLEIVTRVMVSCRMDVEGCVVGPFFPAVAM